MSWEKQKAEDYCAGVTDGTHDSPKAVESGRYLITSKHLGEYEIDFSSAKLISEEDYQKVISRSRVAQWDILFSMIGTIGNTYLEKNEIVEYACKNMGIFQMGGDKQKAYWLYYFLKSPQAYQYIISQLRGSTQQYVPLGGLREFPIPVPSDQIRDKIIDVLKVIDEKIETNKRINRNLLEQLDLEWNNIFNGVPMDISLGNVVRTTSGGTPSRKNALFYEGGDVYWVKSKELCGSFIVDTEEKITEIAIQKSSAKLIPAYSILIAMYGATVGEYAIITENMTCNQAICALIPSEEYPSSYLFELAKQSKEKLINMAIGSAQQNISQILIKQLQIHSDKGKINQYTAFAEPMMKLIENNIKENIQLVGLRDSLLPKLMSGELDISDLNI